MCVALVGHLQSRNLHFFFFFLVKILRSELRLDVPAECGGRKVFRGVQGTRVGGVTGSPPCWAEGSERKPRGGGGRRPPRPPRPGLAPASPRPEDSAPLEPGGMKAGKRENRNAFRRRRDASRRDHRVHLRTACAQHGVGVRALGTEPGAGSWSLLFPRKRISPSRSRV